METAQENTERTNNQCLIESYLLFKKNCIGLGIFNLKEIQGLFKISEELKR